MRDRLADLEGALGGRRNQAALRPRGLAGAGEAREAREERALELGASEWLEALVQRDVDLALCPVEVVREALDDRVEIVGVPERGDPRDALLGARNAPLSLDALPRKGTVAVPDVRAGGLLKARRPDLVTVPAADLADDLALVDRGVLDGVIASRNRVAGTLDEGRIGQLFPAEEWVPAPGQAALAILARRGEAGAIEAAGRLIDRHATRAVRAEVAVVRALGLACAVGLGAVGFPVPGGMRLRGLLVSADGRQMVRAEVMVAEGGRSAAVLARAMRRRGADLVAAPTPG